MMDKDKKDILSSGFRTKLEDYELPIREDLWTEIERDLPQATKTSRPLWVTVGSVAASIALILSLSWGIFKTLNNPASDIASVGVSEPMPNPTNNQPGVQEVVETKGESTSKSLVKGSPKPLYANANLVEPAEPLQEKLKETEPARENETPEGKKEQSVPIEEESKEIPPFPNRYTADVLDDIPNPKKEKDLSLALAFSNQGNPSNSVAGGNSLLRYSELFLSVSTMNENEKANNVVISDKKYKTPITFSFSVRKKLNNRWALESGLTYTYLESSELRTYTNGEHFSDTYEANSVGIPLKVSYSIYNIGNLAIYASGGGMVEKSVYARKTSTENNTKEKIDIPELQWSVGGNVGLGYKVVRKLHLFVEPGINYYFDNKSEIPTIRKDMPLNFNLQLGLRLDI
jgi:hypothetical protein